MEVNLYARECGEECQMWLTCTVAPLFKGVKGFYVEILRAANGAALRMTSVFGNRAK
jgi:hypothetical protein